MNEPTKQQPVATRGHSPTSLRFEAVVLRCHCSPLLDGPERLAAVTRRHGLDAAGLLLPCPFGITDESSRRTGTWFRNPFRRLLHNFGLVGLATLAMIALVMLSFAAGNPTPLALAPFAIGATLQVNGGRAIVTNRLLGAGTEPKYIGWGTGAGTTGATDTTLFTEKLVDLSTSAGTDHTTGTGAQATTSTTNDTYSLTGTRTATGAGTVTNSGSFDAASGGNLHVKGDFTGIALAIGDAISYTIKTQFS